MMGSAGTSWQDAIPTWLAADIGLIMALLQPVIQQMFQAVMQFLFRIFAGYVLLRLVWEGFKIVAAATGFWDAMASVRAIQIRFLTTVMVTALAMSSDQGWSFANNVILRSIYGTVAALSISLSQKANPNYLMPSVCTNVVNDDVGGVSSTATLTDDMNCLASEVMRPFSLGFFAATSLFAVNYNSQYWGPFNDFANPASSTIAGGSGVTSFVFGTIDDADFQVVRIIFFALYVITTLFVLGIIYIYFFVLIFRIAVLVVLIPIIIIGFAEKAFRQQAEAILWALINSALVMFFWGLFAVLWDEVVGTMVGSALAAAGISQVSQCSTACSSSVIVQMFQNYTGAQQETVGRAFMPDQAGGIMLIGLGLFFALMNTSSSLAGMLSRGASDGLGAARALPGAVVQLASAAANMVTAVTLLTDREDRRNPPSGPAAPATQSSAPPPSMGGLRFDSPPEGGGEPPDGGGSSGGSGGGSVGGSAGAVGRGFDALNASWNGASSLEPYGSGRSSSPSSGGQPSGSQGQGGLTGASAFATSSLGAGSSSVGNQGDGETNQGSQQGFSPDSSSPQQSKVLQAFGEVLKGVEKAAGAGNSLHQSGQN